jgi:hypothetical protein
MFPKAGEYAVLRCTTVFLHALAAGLMVLLTFRLFRDLRAALFSGLLFAVYPPALALIDAGYSEHAWLVMAASGLLLVFRKGWKPMAGALLLGLSVLARSNFLLLPATLAVVATVHRPGLFRHWRSFVLPVAVFLLPAFLWMLRNYMVSGAFPLLNAMEGETFYGSNNSRVTTDLRYWGYWVFLDDIPGETPKQQLGRRMTEADLNQYYRNKGLAYVRENWFAYPRLVLGKVIRGFVPVPWVPLATSYLACMARVMLYLLFLWSWRARVLRSEPFGLFLAAVLLVVVVTTVVFYGNFRFTFCLEAFLMPCAAVLLAQRWRALRGDRIRFARR